MLDPNEAAALISISKSLEFFRWLAVRGLEQAAKAEDDPALRALAAEAKARP